MARWTLFDKAGRVAALCAAVLWLLAAGGQVTASGELVRKSAFREYCETETFEPTCDDDEVVVMTTATYGRMRIGRCVKKTLGYIGCHRDVLELADTRCSGLQTCQIRMPDPMFDKTRPCLEELKTYLEAAFQCVKVMTPSHPCNDGKQWVIANTEGYLSGLMATKYNCGTTSFPVVMHGLPGQQVNLTLLTFDTEVAKQGAAHAQKRTRAEEGNPRSKRYGENCVELGLIIDKMAGRTIPICLGRNRVRHLYLSRNSTVEMVLRTATEGARAPARFLIHFKVVGCQDISPPEGSWIRRHRQEAEIGCYATKEVWTLICVDGAWVGTIGNCSLVAPPIGSKDHTHNPMAIPHGISVIIIVTIALGIGVVVLICGIFLFRRLKRHSDRDDSGATFRHEGEVEELEQLKVNYDNEVQQKMQLNSELHLHNATIYDKTYKELNGYAPVQVQNIVQPLTPDVIHAIRRPDVTWKLTTMPGCVSNMDAAMQNCGNDAAANAHAAAANAHAHAHAHAQMSTFKDATDPNINNPHMQHHQSCKLPTVREAVGAGDGGSPCKLHGPPLDSSDPMRKSCRSFHDPTYDTRPPCVHNTPRAASRTLTRNPRNIYESRRLRMPYNLNNSF